MSLGLFSVEVVQTFGLEELVSFSSCETGDELLAVEEGETVDDGRKLMFS